MNGRTTMIRWSFLAGLVACLLATGAARAASNPATCLNDIDCVATPNCGGDVCDYATQPPTCKPAGTAVKGSDGWCSADSDCKCASLGATCTSNFVYCTFTKPSDAPSGGAGSGGGGGSGTAGSTGAAGSGNSGGGGGGGCSLGGSTPLGGSLAFAAVGLVLALIRRRARG